MFVSCFIYPSLIRQLGYCLILTKLNFVMARVLVLVHILFSISLSNLFITPNRQAIHY